MQDVQQAIGLLVIGLVVGLVIGYDFRKHMEERAARRAMYKRVKEGAAARLQYVKNGKIIEVVETVGDHATLPRQNGGQIDISNHNTENQKWKSM